MIFGRRPHSRGYRGGTPEKIFNFFFKNQKLTYRYKKSRSFKYLRTPVWLRQAFKNLLGQYDPPPWEIGLKEFSIWLQPTSFCLVDWQLFQFKAFHYSHWSFSCDKQLKKWRCHFGCMFVCSLIFCLPFATCILQHAICSMQFATCNFQCA